MLLQVSIFRIFQNMQQMYVLLVHLDDENSHQHIFNNVAHNNIILNMNNLDIINVVSCHYLYIHVCFLWLMFVKCSESDLSKSAL